MLLFGDSSKGEEEGLNRVGLSLGLPRWLSGKESTCHCRRHKESDTTEQAHVHGLSVTYPMDVPKVGWDRLMKTHFIVYLKIRFNRASFTS